MSCQSVVHIKEDMLHLFQGSQLVLSHHLPVQDDAEIMVDEILLIGAATWLLGMS